MVAPDVVRRLGAARDDGDGAVDGVIAFAIDQQIARW
jgi:hypothetical protein